MPSKQQSWAFTLSGAFRGHGDASFTIMKQHLPKIQSGSFGNLSNATIESEMEWRCIRLVWDTISTPRRLGSAFSSTIRAKDYLGATVTAFNSTNTLRAVQIGGSATNVLLTNAAPTRVANEGTYTLGYSFTPSTDMFVTHLRQFSGSKAMLWADEGYPLATNAMTVTSGIWTETLLASPVLLRQGKTYRVTFLTGGQEYYSRADAPVAFPNGTIKTSYYGIGDVFPENVDNTAWYLVDLRYVLPANISPSSSGNFSSGVWTGNTTVNATGQFRMMADDNNGHIG